MTPSKPIWHIAGIGALGTVIATSFSQAGHNIQLIVKNKNQLSHYQTHSLNMVFQNKITRCHPAAINIQQLSLDPIHQLICCVKAYDVTPLLVNLKHRLNKDSIIILIHNGIGVLDEIKNKRSDLRIISGLSSIGAYCKTPFNVQAFLKGNIFLGASLGKFSSTEITNICNSFQSTTLNYQWSENIQQHLWEKFAINCSINLLTVMLSAKNEQLIQHQHFLKQLTDEISLVLTANNIDVSSDQLYTKVIKTLQITNDNYSSMYKDIQQNKRTEIDYLNKQLVQLATLKNIPTPITNVLLNRFYTLVSRTNIKK